MQLNIKQIVMRVYISVLVLGLITSQTALAQVVDWQKGKNWRLYDTLPSSENFDVKSLNVYRSIELSEQSMHHFLKNDSLLAAERTRGAVWMGFYRVSCSIEDSTKILIVSRYGGFFADLATKQYYQIPIPEISDWNGYFDSKFSDLHKKTGH